jgi:hypothetical protein
MVQGQWLSREFDLLEAQMAMTLASPILPMEKRVEFERRLESIRLKTAAQRSQTAATRRETVTA